MAALWRTVRRLLGVLPPGTRRFVVLFATLQSLLAILDVAALGLLAVILAPMLTGGETRLPVLGTIAEPAQFRDVLLGVGLPIVTQSALAIVPQGGGTEAGAAV